jgi:hypothetical protein
MDTTIYYISPAIGMLNIESEGILCNSLEYVDEIPGTDWD